MPAGSCSYEEPSPVMDQAAKRPFHETIIDAISFASNEQLELLATLIKTTKIPKNHDAIIAAWKQRLIEVGARGGLWRRGDSGVPASLEHQKRYAVAEEAAKTQNT